MDEIVSVVSYHDHIIIFTKYGKVFSMEIAEFGGRAFDFTISKLGELPTDILRL